MGLRTRCPPPPTILEISLKIQHVCQGAVWAQGLSHPPFCVKLGGRPKPGGWFRPLTPGGTWKEDSELWCKKRIVVQHSHPCAFISNSLIRNPRIHALHPKTAGLILARRACYCCEIGVRHHVFSGFSFVVGCVPKISLWCGILWFQEKQMCGKLWDGRPRGHPYFLSWILVWHPILCYSQWVKKFFTGVFEVPLRRV